MGLIIIHAPNVHLGGGKVLLCDVLSALNPKVEHILILDKRLDLELPDRENVHAKYITPSLVGRLWAEIWLLLHVRVGDSVLCFGNLPPLFRLRGDTVVYLQNRYLVDPKGPVDGMHLKTRLRIWLERVWLRWRRFDAGLYIVQTASMKKLAAAILERPVICLPFVPQSIQSQVCITIKKQFDFLYVASGEAHKNHETLINAWCLLAEEGLFPSLALTLSPEITPALCARVDQENTSRGLRIQNIGFISQAQLVSLYCKSGALIYPSSFESFGLPLMEARQAGLSVLAPELDYVRDVTDPDETFDPRSPISIARAVRRHLRGRKPNLQLHTARDLLDLLLITKNL